MKLIEHLIVDQTLTDENITYLRQLGVNDVNIAFQDHTVADPSGLSPLSGLRRNPSLELHDLLALKEWVASRGMNVVSMSMPPFAHWDKIYFGLPGRDEQIENMKKSVRNLGAAGIGLWHFSWHYNTGSAIPLWRTSYEEGRGGAKITRFDAQKVKDIPLTKYGELKEDDAWQNFFYFLKAVLPVAEESGVSLSFHPADPQVESIAGIARLLRSVETYDRMFDAFPSSSLKMTFCLGCFAQMMEADEVYGCIDRYGRAGKIGLVHFRNVNGTLLSFDEVFPDEGKLDMITALKAFHDAGFSGPIRPDHVPHMSDDEGFGYRGRAFQIGYLRGVLQAAMR